MSAFAIRAFAYRRKFQMTSRKINGGNGDGVTFAPPTNHQTELIVLIVMFASVSDGILCTCRAHSWDCDAKLFSWYITYSAAAEMIHDIWHVWSILNSCLRSRIRPSLRMDGYLHRQAKLSTIRQVQHDVALLSTVCDLLAVHFGTHVLSRAPLQGCHEASSAESHGRNCWWWKLALNNFISLHNMIFLSLLSNSGDGLSTHGSYSWASGSVSSRSCRLRKYQPMLDYVHNSTVALLWRI